MSAFHSPRALYRAACLKQHAPSNRLKDRRTSDCVARIRLPSPLHGSSRLQGCLAAHTHTKHTAKARFLSAHGRALDVGGDAVDISALHAAGHAAQRAAVRAPRGGECGHARVSCFFVGRAFVMVCVPCRSSKSARNPNASRPVGRALHCSNRLWLVLGAGGKRSGGCVFDCARLKHPSPANNTSTGDLNF